MNRIHIAIFVLLGMMFNLSNASSAEVSIDEVCASLPCRPATTISIPLGNRPALEIKFPKAPYVHQGRVNILAGETLTIGGEETDGKLTGLRYLGGKPAKDPENTLVFKLEHPGGTAMLSVTNHFAKPVKYRAAMQPGGKSVFYETSSCPVAAGLGAFESWPHPIVQLVLMDFRFLDPGGRSVCE